MKDWKTEIGDETIIKTCAWSAPGCHPVGCGLKLHVKDGELVKVEGDPDHPITRGALCPRCLALKEYVYHPDRIIYPMKRAFEDRGKDTWERISWDEALDLVEEKLKEYTETYGPESILMFHGTGREPSKYSLQLAFMALGTPNDCYAQSGWSCYGPRAAVMAFIMGGGYPEVDYACRFPDRYDHPGWEPPKYIILWGKEPLKSNGDGFWGHSIIDMMKLGSKIICIDPRVTWLGTRSDMVLQLRPGTDTALALAMLNVIINENLYDEDIVDRWTYGFKELAERVQEYPPEKVEEITWVPAEDIRSAARKFATGNNSAIGWGLAIDQNPNGVQLAHCIIAMLMITDNLDVPGGCTLGKPIDNDIMFDMKDLAMNHGILTDEMWEKRIGAKEYPGVCSIMNTTHPDATLRVLESGDPYKIHMAFFHCSSPVGSAISAQPDKWYEALKKVDFCVIVDTFMNPTAMGVCDLFLPVSTFAEHDGFVESHYGYNAAFQGAINKAITVGEAKSDIEIMIEIGKRMFPEYWNEFEDAPDYLVKTGVIPNNMSFEEFREASPVQPEEVYRKYEKGLQTQDGSLGFMTRTGRVELYSYAFQSLGDDPLPYYEEPPFSPVSTSELFKEYPLILTTGARTFYSFHSEHRQINSLREMHPNPLLDIHPETAAKLDIKEGDWVCIENMFGKCKQVAHLTETIHPMVVHAEHGWWYPEKSAEAPGLYGGWESNINLLMPNDYLGPMGWGDTFKNQICRVLKIEE